MHVGWTSPWSQLDTRQPKPIREWVAICPKCNQVLRANSTLYYASTGKPTRKAAKDALHDPMRTFH
jgi:hypothetical protein